VGEFDRTTLMLKKRTRCEVNSRVMGPGMAVGMLLVATAQSVCAQPEWRPEKPVEIILPTAAGGLNDQVAKGVGAE